VHVGGLEVCPMYGELVIDRYCPIMPRAVHVFIYLDAISSCLLGGCGPNR